MTREKLMEYIIEKLRYADTEVLTVIYTLLLYRVPSDREGCP